MNTKTYLFIFLSFIPFVISGQSAVMKINNPKWNFGFVREGEIVQMEFNIQNTGKEPLIITETQVECSCTTVEKPTQPIMPGEYGILKVSFDTKNKMDRQDRTVIIISNAKNSPNSVRFKGVVLKKK